MRQDLVRSKMRKKWQDECSVHGVRMYVCNLQYSVSKSMNVITHAQFCSDPVESNHCVLESRSCVARVVDRLTVVAGGHHIIGDPRWDPCCVPYCCFCLSCFS